MANNNTIQKVLRYLTYSDYRFLVNSHRGLYDLWDDEKYLKREFEVTMKKPLNLDDPKTFNEKLQWLKLNDRKPEYTQMVDKYEVKQYVADKIGEQYIIPTYSVWNSFDNIDFGALPNQFVLKCTHDSGGVIICKDKSTFDKKKAKQKINKSLKRNYYWSGREWPYKNVKPRIIAEEFIDEKKGYLIDYKFFCFNGEVKVFYVTSNRGLDGGLRIDYFDLDWNHLNITHFKYPQNKNQFLTKPDNFQEMLNLAEQLSQGIPFVRVDLYSIDDKIYFGELTFYPDSGFGEFIPDEWDYIFGDWLKLPQKTT